MNFYVMIACFRCSLFIDVNVISGVSGRGRKFTYLGGSWSAVDVCGRVRSKSVSTGPYFAMSNSFIWKKSLRGTKLSECKSICKAILTYES